MESPISLLSGPLRSHLAVEYRSRLSIADKTILGAKEFPFRRHTLNQMGRPLHHPARHKIICRKCCLDIRKRSRWFHCLSITTVSSSFYNNFSLTKFLLYSHIIKKRFSKRITDREGGKFFNIYIILYFTYYSLRNLIFHWEQLDKILV